MIQLTANTPNTGRSCRAEATRLAVVTCPHDHIATVFLCAGHDELGIDEATCRTCTLAGHQCPLTEVFNRIDDLNQLIADNLTIVLDEAGDRERQEIRAFVFRPRREVALSPDSTADHGPGVAAEGGYLPVRQVVALDPLTQAGRGIMHRPSTSKYRKRICGHHGSDKHGDNTRLWIHFVPVATWRDVSWEGEAVSTHEATPSVGQVVGRNLRRIRERHGHTQADAVRLIFDRTGERWTRDQVSTLEIGRREGISLEELLALAHTYDIPLADLFVGSSTEGGSEVIRILPVRAGRSFMVSSEGIQRALQGDRVHGVATPADAPALQRWLSSVLEADRAVAGRLAVGQEKVLKAAVELWGHSLTEERDARLGGDISGLPPRTIQAKRGAMTRVLTGEIQAYLNSEGGGPDPL